MRKTLNVGDDFFEQYSIYEEDAKRLRDLSGFDKVYEGAKLIYEKSIDLDMRTCDALAQISPRNLARLLDMDERSVGNLISKQYAPSEHTKTSQLREQVMKQYKNDFVLNMASGEKNSGRVDFSFNDQIDGFKLPEKLDNKHFFLLGIYKTDGIPVNEDKNRFKLSGKTGDERLYKEIVEPLIYNTFNLKAKTHEVDRVKESGPRFSEWTDVYIELISQGHYSYLRDLLKFFDRPLDIESLAAGDGQESYDSYLMGLIAGGGHLARRDSRLIMKFHDMEQNYLPELKRTLGFDYSNPPKKPHYLSINQGNLEKMLSYEPAFQISEEQIGLFTNPRHTEVLRTIL